MSWSNFLLYLLLGTIAITLIDTFGAVLSRRLQFKYRYLSILSFTVYITIGLLVSKQLNLIAAISIGGLLGLYDGTIGCWLSIKLGANNDLSTEQANKLLGAKTAISMTVVGMLLSLIGYGLTFL